MSPEFLSSRPLISLVIPTRNEAQDIAPTLEACLAIDYDPKEIIVVDDSTDETPRTVASYADQGVRFVHRTENRNGCCGARTLGMKMAKGEIVVLLNADNRPRPDFLNRLLPHYLAGADYVIVRSLVINRNNVWGKYIHAQSQASLSGEPDVKWSEGFSCRRTAAEAVGYFPGDFPVPFCRDWRLGEGLRRAGFNKHFDPEIPMEHVIPGTLETYWRNQIWRGTFSAPTAYYFGKRSLPIILAREILKAGRGALRNLLIFPALIRAIRLSAYTDRGWPNAPELFFAGVVQDAATSVGNFRGFKILVQNLRRKAK